MTRAAIFFVAVFAFAGKAGAQEFKVVKNNCDQPVQQFRVVANKAGTRLATVAKAVAGCGCSRGYNCSAGFCKANGGSGCPSDCPIQAYATKSVPQPAQSVPAVVGELPFNYDPPHLQSQPPTFRGQYSNCPNGQCPSERSGSDGWRPGKIIGKILR